jgi:RHS repeat-associated protein
MSESSSTGASLASFSWDTVTGGKLPLDIDDGTNAYIYGPLQFGGTAPVEQINLSTGAINYLASTPSGVQAVFDSSGILKEQAVYTTYGVRILQANTSVVTPFGFQGSYTDASGLIYLIHRYYTPQIAQFISVDPELATTGQPYAFTSDNPLNSEDPLGLHCFPVCTVVNAYHHAVKYYHKVKKILHSAVVHHVLNTVSKVAGGVAAVSSSVAFVPVVGQVAESISIGAGSVALGADALNCVGGHCDGAAFAADAAAMVPAVGAARAGEVLRDASSTLDLTKGVGSAIEGSDSISTSMRAINASEQSAQAADVASAQVKQFSWRYAARGGASAAWVVGMATST